MVRTLGRSDFGFAFLHGRCERRRCKRECEELRDTHAGECAVIVRVGGIEGAGTFFIVLSALLNILITSIISPQRSPHYVSSGR